jgi:hypothetical protein
MGLLDDAIREHLELKRQHGADAEEVARQEREALGPSRRTEPEPVEAAAVPAEPEVEAGPEPGDELPEGAAPETEPPDEEDPWLPDEEEPGAEPEGEQQESDDVLEETPEFLQETPEHDRLWFEQKPPRDFDWDR